jgi:uncharacterized protein DUF5679
MRRIKHHSRSVSQLLIVGLLSCWVALLIGLLSYWLVVLRLIKSILKRKEKREVNGDLKSALIADTGESLVLSPNVEPESPTVATNVEPEPPTVATNVESEPPTVATNVEPELPTVVTKVKAESGVLATDTIEAYCVKCRQRRVIEGAKKITTQRGRRAMEGTCPICGTKIFRFIAREKETLP